MNGVGSGAGGPDPPRRYRPGRTRDDPQVGRENKRPITPGFDVSQISPDNSLSFLKYRSAKFAKQS